MPAWPPAETAVSRPCVPGAGLGARVSAGAITVSIVSHGHGEWLQSLLPALARTSAGLIAEVIVVHNLPDPRWLAPRQDWPFVLTEIDNTQPVGFGANHNRAFAHCRTPLFVVLNPDVGLDGDPSIWRALVAAAQAPGVGCAYPVLLNTDGSVQDNQRAVPTPYALWLRRVLHRPDSRVEWASAAFWMVPSEVYKQLGGFDERFFMYCEDTDFCLRLQVAGWSLAQAPARATHHAQRSSGRSVRHLTWHLASLWRLWTGQPLRRFFRSRQSAGRPDAL